MRIPGFLLFVFFCTLPLVAQVTFSAFPQQLQFYGRTGLADTGSVTIAGTVTGGETDSTLLRVIIYRNGTRITSLDPELTAADAGSPTSFSLRYGIPAELAMYRFEAVAVHGSTETVLRSADSVVCGDVYIIQGQSNAEAHSFLGSASANRSPFIRVFGYSLDSTDKQWRIGQGDGDQSTPGNTGQWGLRMARLIVDNENVPVAIFNGCRSGMPISFFARDNEEPQNLSTNYGLLLRRLTVSGLAGRVKTLFWFQGERDANDGTGLTEYKKAFWELRESWQTDYPQISRWYVIQIGSGCNTSGIDPVVYSELVNQIKEAQRQLGEEIPDVTVMSSSASEHFNDGWVSCHYPFQGGYEPIGNNAYWLLARDVYGKPVQAADAPTVRFAEITGKEEITLFLNNHTDSVTWYPGSESAFRIEESSATVTAGRTFGSRIVLSLSEAPTGAAGISYLGNPSPAADPIVTNRKGIGAVHFYQFPLTTPHYRDSVAVAAILAANGITLPHPSVADYSGGRMVSLVLNAMNIAVIPSEIGYLDSLKRIAVIGNRLQTLPREITNLPVLSSVDVNHNYICAITDSLEAWIDRTSSDTAWKRTQKSDVTHYCDGAGVQPDRQWRRSSSAKVSMHFSGGSLMLNVPSVADVRFFLADGTLALQHPVIAGNHRIDLRSYHGKVLVVKVECGGLVTAQRIVVP